MKTVGSHTTNSSLSSAVTIDTPEQASHVLLAATTQAVRVTLDGTTPTASVGLHIPAGAAPVELPVGLGSDIKVIEEAGSATIDYQFIQK